MAFDTTRTFGTYPDATTIIPEGNDVFLGSAQPVPADDKSQKFATTDFVHLLIPTGTILAFGAETLPSEYSNYWLLCDGRAVSRTTYSRLFAVIGTSFGSGNGSTTFNLPDLRGRVPAGLDDMGGTAANRLTTAGSGINGRLVGAAGGAQTHTLTEAQMPAHNHTGTANSAGEHTHTLPNGRNISGSAYRLVDVAEPQSSTTNSGSAGAHTHTLTINNAGGGQAHNNVQPTLIVNYIIKCV
jgi:Microcystin-dependent protein